MFQINKFIIHLAFGRLPYTLRASLKINTNQIISTKSSGNNCQIGVKDILTMKKQNKKITIILRADTLHIITNTCVPYRLDIQPRWMNEILFH